MYFNISTIAQIYKTFPINKQKVLRLLQGVIANLCRQLTTVWACVPNAVVSLSIASSQAFIY